MLLPLNCNTKNGNNYSLSKINRINPNFVLSESEKMNRLDADFMAEEVFEDDAPALMNYNADATNFVQN